MPALRETDDDVGEDGRVTILTYRSTSSFQGRGIEVKRAIEITVGKGAMSAPENAGQPDATACMLAPELERLEIPSLFFPEERLPVKGRPKTAGALSHG
jgi:hypothetical protein